jgi:hypothetical protein
LIQNASTVGAANPTFSDLDKNWHSESSTPLLDGAQKSYSVTIFSMCNNVGFTFYFAAFFLMIRNEIADNT